MEGDGRREMEGDGARRPLAHFLYLTCQAGGGGGGGGGASLEVMLFYSFPWLALPLTFMLHPPLSHGERGRWEMEDGGWCS